MADLRIQLTEQGRMLNARGDKKQELVHDLAAFIQKHAEIERDYAAELEKLYDRFSRTKRRGFAQLVKSDLYMSVVVS